MCGPARVPPYKLFGVVVLRVLRCVGESLFVCCLENDKFSRLKGGFFWLLAGSEEHGAVHETEGDENGS